MLSNFQNHIETLLDLTSKRTEFKHQLDHSVYKDLDYLILIGKASELIFKQIETGLIGQKTECLIISPNQIQTELNSHQWYPASHPLPTKKSLASTLVLITWCKEIPAGSNVGVVITGGTSSMLCLPPDGIEVEELAKLNRLLLNSGADIEEINTVRKHVSDIKGGKLAKHLSHVKLTSIIYSDVPGDDPSVVGSGPTNHDPTTFQDAFDVFDKYVIWDEVPESVLNHIQKGVEGIIPETPKPGADEHPNHEVIIISPAILNAISISENLQKEGFNTWVSEEAYSASTKDVCRMICQKVISVLSKQDELKKPAALIFYGESYPEIKGAGKGGRNQELALMVAISLEGQHNVSMLSYATDGVDGPTDAAGAIITSFTTLNARKQGLNPESYLQNNDSYSFFEKTNELIKTGPTGNNMMDLQVILIN